MKRNVLTFILAAALFAVGWLGMNWAVKLLKHEAVDARNANPSGQTGGSRTLIQEAVEDYNAGRFKEALPKFQRYVASRKVDLQNLNSSDVQNVKLADAYIIDIQDQLASGKPLRPMEQSQLVARTQAIVNAQSASAPSAANDDRVPHKPIPAGQVATMTIKELGNFEFDPEKQKEADIPADIKAMEGTHLKLSGYMIPDTQAEQITHFALVPSLTSCCYGQPPGVQHVIVVTMAKGKTLDFTTDELEVVGTLHVHVLRQDGYTYQIFEMTGDDAKVKGYVN